MHVHPDIRINGSSKRHDSLLRLYATPEGLETLRNALHFLDISIGPPRAVNQKLGAVFGEQYPDTLSMQESSVSPDILLVDEIKGIAYVVEVKSGNAPSAMDTYQKQSAERKRILKQLGFHPIPVGIFPDAIVLGSSDHSAKAFPAPHNLDEIYSDEVSADVQS